MAVGNIIPPRRGTAAMWKQPFLFVGRAGGSICWCTDGNSVVLHLDDSSGEFSCFTLPDVNPNQQMDYDRLNLRVVGGDAGAVHLVRLVRSDIEVLRYARGGGGGECVVEKRVPVSQVVAIDGNYCGWYFTYDTSAEAGAPCPGRIVLCHNECEVEFVCMFSVHTQDIELQRREESSGDYIGEAVVFPYELPWTISACLQDEADQH